jgi:energy-coupling factor transport system permease protein
MQALTARPSEATSWLHRLDPAAKLLWLLPITLFCFTTSQPAPLLAFVAGVVLVAASARVLLPLSRVMAVFVPISASIVVVQAIAPASCAGSCVDPVALGPLTLYHEGISHAITLVLRITAFQASAFVVLLTTRPPDLLASLARLRVPYAGVFMVATTLQLVPVLQREVGLVIAAQRARGMRGTGFGALIPSFVPVAAAAVDRVQQLAISLEARGFGASGPKTSYRGSRVGVADFVIGAVGFVGLAGLVVLGVMSWSAASAPGLVLPQAAVIGLFLACGALFVGIVFAGVRAVARL